MNRDRVAADGGRSSSRRPRRTRSRSPTSPVRAKTATSRIMRGSSRSTTPSMPGSTMLSGTSAGPRPADARRTAPSACEVRTRAARAEARRAADLLDDPGEAVVGVVQDPLAVGERSQRDRRRGPREDRFAARRCTNSSHETTSSGPCQVPSGQRADREVGDALLDRLLQQPCGAGTRAGGSRRPGGARARPGCSAAAGRPPSRAPSPARARRPRGRERRGRSGGRGRPPAGRCAPPGSSVRPAGVSETPRGRRSRQGTLELVLERPDVLRERRLRDPEPAGRTRERALLDHRHEAFELPKIHSQNLSLPVPSRPLDLCSARPRETPSRVRATRINHVSIAAADLEESTRFYEEVFGMERIPTPTFADPVQWLRVGDLQLHLFLDSAHAARPSPRRDHDRRLRRRLSRR